MADRDKMAKYRTEIQQVSCVTDFYVVDIPLIQGM